MFGKTKGRVGNAHQKSIEDGAVPMRPHAEIGNNDILFGMKAISQYLGRSESTIIKFIQEYEDFPVRKNNGKGYTSCRSKLDEWFRKYVSEK